VGRGAHSGYSASSFRCWRLLCRMPRSSLSALRARWNAAHRRPPGLSLLRPCRRPGPAECKHGRGAARGCARRPHLCSQPARLPAAQGAQKPGRSRGTLNRPCSQTRNASRQRVSSASSIASFLKPRMTSRATCPQRRAASALAHAQNPRSANPRSTVPSSPGRHQERVLLGLIEAAHAALLQPGRAAALRDVHDLRYKHRHGLGREGRVEDLRPGPPVSRGSQA